MVFATYAKGVGKVANGAGDIYTLWKCVYSTHEVGILPIGGWGPYLAGMGNLSTECGDCTNCG
jgi:hypothetical protein